MNIWEMIKSAISGLIWAFIIIAVRNFSSEFSGDGQSTINWGNVILWSAIMGAVIGLVYVIMKELCEVWGVVADFGDILRYPKKTINKMAFGFGAFAVGFIGGLIERSRTSPGKTVQQVSPVKDF